MRRDLLQLRSHAFDVAIVGGGMHGAWIALRAAQAGLRVALIEREDFGAATSTNSLNILHGGLRYLQHLDFARMRSSIRARREFCRQSPEVVRPLQCVMPLQATGVRSPWTLGPALLLNDLISADRNLGVVVTARLPRGRLLSGSECRRLITPLADVEAVGGAVWWDAVALDAARLTLDAIVEAVAAGAVVANHVTACRYLVAAGAIEGLEVQDALSGDVFEVRAPIVVNASGPWAGELSRISNLPASFMPPGWVGGLNVVLRRSLGIQSAVALSAASKAADASAVLQRATRELFFVPWRGVTAVGTDYHPIRDPDEGIGVPESAIDGFVAEIDRVAPRAGLTRADVAAVQWGLLPRDASGTALPRKAPIVASGRIETGADGLVVVIGEKLTSAPTLSLSVVRGVLRQLASRGQQKPRPDVHAAPARYAAEPRTDSLARLGNENPVLLRELAPGYEARGVDVVYAIREEMAMGLEDIVLRRLGLGYLGHPGMDVLRRCARIAAPEFGWHEATADRAVTEMDARWERPSREAAGSGGKAA